MTPARNLHRGLNGTPVSFPTLVGLSHLFLARPSGASARCLSTVVPQAKVRRQPGWSPSHGHARPFSSTSPARRKAKPPSVPRPSSNVILVSPTNQVLLLQHVKGSGGTPSAHVFPGAVLSSFHDPLLVSLKSQDRHRDTPPYRVAALRGIFEQSGILLAKPPQSHDALLALPRGVREKARRDTQADRVKFLDWVEGHLGAGLCVDDLVPFTRWISPTSTPKRFTNQTYIFFMPLARSSHRAPAAGPVHVGVVQTSTPDGDVEHIKASFDDPSGWLWRQRDGEVMLLPSQFFLLTLVARVFDSVRPRGVWSSLRAKYAAQRRALVDFVYRTPTSGAVGAGSKGPRRSAFVPWAEKIICPYTLFFRRSDNGRVMALDKPGLEVRTSSAAGDYENVVVFRSDSRGPRHIEVRNRHDVMLEEEGVPPEPRRKAASL